MLDKNNRGGVEFGLRGVLSVAIALRTVTGLLGVAVLAIFSMGASVAHHGALRARFFCTPTDQTVQTYPGDCDGDPKTFELEYQDACCSYDTGEEADEDIVCTDPHETCTANCPTQEAKIYDPPKPKMYDDTFDQLVYWEEYDEEYEGSNQCTNSCVNGYTDVVNWYFGGDSSDYSYFCYC